MSKFRVGITRDFLRADGTLGLGDIGLALLDLPHVEREFLISSDGEIPPDVADEYDALLVLAPRVTERTVTGCKRLGLVARFGVGYDTVDVPACTQHDVLLTITPDGVRRPVAVSALTLILALAHKLLIKDKLTRAGRWSEKLDHLGMGLAGRTLGVIGLGNIGREVFRVALPLAMRHVGHDPFVGADQAAAMGVQWLVLDQLLAEADFVVICCALTAETRRLIDARRLALLKPTAYLINVARGPIVDQAALTAALQQRRIAGAGLDVFDPEPIDPRDPLLALDNVILAPHALCWTDECFLGNGRSACEAILDYAAGRVPRHVVNRDVLDRPGMQAKLKRLAT
ncbi:MAG TPA: NAD(P)-dependent oxidoreductase [Pirellulaceae bacterium]|nr:NAD(P)-dependent oxidoreductase [Pirellulaceae bacterium]